MVLQKGALISEWATLKGFNEDMSWEGRKVCFGWWWLCGIKNKNKKKNRYECTGKSILEILLISFIYFLLVEGQLYIKITSTKIKLKFRGRAFWNWNRFSASFSACSCFTGIWNVLVSTVEMQRAFFTPSFPFAHVLYVSCGYFGSRRPSTYLWCVKQ